MKSLKICRCRSWYTYALNGDGRSPNRSLDRYFPSTRDKKLVSWASSLGIFALNHSWDARKGVRSIHFLSVLQLQLKSEVSILCYTKLQITSANGLPRTCI